MKRYTITVNGSHKQWAFNFDGREKDLPAWIEDGLDVSEVVREIPESVVGMGLTKPWVFLQNIGILPK